MRECFQEGGRRVGVCEVPGRLRGGGGGVLVVVMRAWRVERGGEGGGSLVWGGWARGGVEWFGWMGWGGWDGGVGSGSGGASVE